MKHRLTFTGAALAALTFAIGPAYAYNCPRGDLDKQYCDSDGNLIADVPPDPADWLDPETLTFAYTPVEDPAAYKEVWAGFLDTVFNHGLNRNAGGAFVDKAEHRREISDKGNIL